MDSLTQILLGGAVMAAVVPARDRRRALAAGALLGTLPDLDVIPLAWLALDPIANVSWHRGPSHSLFVLAALGFLIHALLRRRWAPVRDAPGRWLAAIQLALLTHPLLDSMTSYGTQLFWPLPMRPVMLSSVFIIDPLYTVPLLIAFVAALILGARAAARSWLVVALAVSTAYLGWSLLAKARVDAAAERALAARGLQDAPRFSTPSPFNTLLWQVVVMTPDGYLTADRSLVADHGEMRFRAQASETRALEAVKDRPEVRRLIWFTHGFLKAERLDDRLVLSDLRMGVEPDYSFRYAVARRDDGQWIAIPVEQLSWPLRVRERLPLLWRRIWNEAAD